MRRSLSVGGGGGEDDAGAAEVVGLELKVDDFAEGEADEVEAVFAGGAGDAAMAVGELDAVGAVLEGFDDGSACLELVGVGHEGS